MSFKKISLKKMNSSEVRLIKDKKINDNNWSCLVILLIEANSNSMSGIELFEKSVRSSKRTDIQNLNPHDLEALFTKEKVNLKDASQQESPKTRHKSVIVDINKSPKLSPIKLQALQLKKYILEYKINDLAKRAETIRYLLNNEIISTDSDSSILDSEYGSFCYFVLTKFYDPSLINNLIEIGVPLVAVLEFRVDTEYHRWKSANRLSINEATKQRTDSIDLFWEHFLKQLNNPENKDYFSEFLFLPIEITSEQWNGKKKGDIILEHISLKLLSINRLMRKYIHYINNVEIIEAPTIFKECKMDIYNNLLDTIPLECVTIELILHSIVEQVVAHFEGDHTESNIEDFKNVLEEKEIKFPLLFINHRDKIRRMTFNLKTNNQLNLNDISYNMHSQMSYATIWNYYPQQTEVEKALNANQIKKLLTCAKEVIDEGKFLVILHLISFNKLLYIASHSRSQKIYNSMYDQQLLSFSSILDKDDDSKILKDNKVYSEVRPNILTKRFVHLNSLKNFLDCSEYDSLISYDFFTDLYDLRYTEDLPKESLLQILNKAYFNYLHYDYYYCFLTDKLLLWFHNFCDENGLCSWIQEGLLNSKIGFGDFYTYPDDEIMKWLSNQKKQITSIDDTLKKSYLARNFSDINPLSFVLNPSVKVKIPFPKKEYMNTKLGKIPFAKVYDLFGSSRIKISEQTDVFFSVDGPSLILKKTKWLRKDGCITLILNSHHHLITLHQSLLNLNSPPVSDASQEIVFNIESNKGIIVSSCLKNKKENEDFLIDSRKDNEVHYETLITLPNGLVIELFRGKYNFIKQTFLDKNHLESDDIKQEDYRIFLSNGTVIVFMNDGSILILYPNSTEARIKIVGKKPPKYPKAEVNESKADDLLEDNEEMNFEIIRHEVIGWNGQFLRFNRDAIILSEQLYELRAAFCSTRGLFTARSDGTKCYVDCDGILTVLFPDQTITTVIPTIETVLELIDSNSNTRSSVVGENTEDEISFEIINNKYIMDHPFYMKVEFVSEQWIVDLPFGGKITANTKGFELAFDKYTNINFNDGLVSVYSKNKFREYKNTLTKIFLKGEMSFEYTLCSVRSSDGKIFNVRNTGSTSLTTVQQMATAEAEEGIKLQPEQILPKKKVKPQNNFKKNSTRQSYSTNLKNDAFATKHFKNQTLLYSKIDVLIDKYSNTSIASTKLTNKVNNSKQSHRFFVLNRNFSGYEFINKYDIKSTLKKYQTNFKVFQPFLPCTTIKEDITVCQLPLMKTWNQLFRTSSCNSRLYNTNLKKNELINIPTDRKWLCISTISIPSQNIKFAYEKKPIPDDIGLKHPALLIRRIKNITTRFNFFNMFKVAIKRFNKLNCEILYKYEKRLLPANKLISDIEKSDMVFKNAMEELMHSIKTERFTEALTKGDSISTIGTSVTSVKIDDSEESDDTDSQINYTSSMSESTYK